MKRAETMQHKNTTGDNNKQVFQSHPVYNMKTNSPRGTNQGHNNNMPPNMPPGNYNPGVHLIQQN